MKNQHHLLDTLNGHPIIRRRYHLGQTAVEEIYLARDRDMFIIRFQARSGQLEKLTEEFQTILDSFGPL